MDNEIQLISDDDGLAVIGRAADVERFLVAEGLSAKDLGPQRLKSFGSAGAAVAQAASEMAADSGRWVKLTPESAQLVKKYGLRESSKTGLSTGVVKGRKGQVGGFVEFAKAPRSLLTNPAVLANAARIMTQVAMQQTMDEITDYLAVIDAKVDDVLRAQKDAVLARMIGVGFVIEEAMTVREMRGGGDEVSWSKVQAAPAAIAETQAYSLRQLDAIAEKMEKHTKIGDLAEAARDAETAVEVARRAGPLLPTAGRGRRARTRPGGGHVSGRAERASPRAEGRQAGPAGTHLAEHRAPCGEDERRCRHSQREGVAAPGQVPGRRPVEEPGRHRRPRLPRAARDRVRPPAVGGAAMGGGCRRGQGQGDRDRSEGPRHRQKPRQRDPRPGRLGHGQAVERHRRANAPTARCRGGARRRRLSRRRRTSITGRPGTEATTYAARRRRRRTTHGQDHTASNLHRS